MAGLRGSLYKDFKLFFSGVGWAALLLPLLLLAALRLGMGDLSAQARVQPFPIAVRDLDGTVMSRALIAQIREVELFSEVRLLEDESDGEALAAGAAAAVTIPKDLFYDLYTMEDCPVGVVLNGDMELEAALFQSIFCSVMDIIGGDQAAAVATYRFVYGEVAGEAQWAMYEEAANQLLADALGRQVDTFDSRSQMTDLAGAVERRLLSCGLSVLIFFFALSAAKTLPEERDMALLPRFRAAGGRTAAFLCSKLLTAALMALPALALPAFLFAGEEAIAAIALSLCLLAGTFFALLGLAAWLPDPAAVQRTGSLLLLLSLALGGTLWPRSVLPAPLALLGELALPHYVSLAVEGAARGYGPLELFWLIWPVLALGLLGLCAAVVGLRYRPGNGHRRAIQAPSAPALGEVPEGRTRGVAARLGALSAMKLWAMAGRWGGSALLLAVALICGMAAAGGRTPGGEALSLAVCDLDGGERSTELVERLSRMDGLSVAAVGPEEGERLLLTGEAEGLLTIEPGYQERLAGGGSPLLAYEGSASSLSVQGVREIVAGQAAVQRSRLRAVERCGELLGRPLTDGEERELLAAIGELEAQGSRLYDITYSGGAEAPRPFVPDPVRFAVLAVFLVLLTAAAWATGSNSRRVEGRMAALPRGRLLARGSDCLALTGLGLLTALAVLLPAGEWSPAVLWTMLCYSFAAGALALHLSRLTALEGRVDGLAPLFALILCLLGGCFIDLEELLPQLEGLALLLPTGLAVRGGEGALWAGPVLCLEGLLFLLPGRRSREA